MCTIVLKRGCSIGLYFIGLWDRKTDCCTLRISSSSCPADDPIPTRAISRQGVLFWPNLFQPYLSVYLICIPVLVLNFVPFLFQKVQYMFQDPHIYFNPQILFFVNKHMNSNKILSIFTDILLTLNTYILHL